MIKKKVLEWYFFSDSLNEYEVEEFLKREIDPSTHERNGEQFRCDYDDFTIEKKTIRYSTESIYQNSKRLFMKELQEKLDILSIVKKHKDMIV